jgi:phospholipase C
LVSPLIEPGTVFRVPNGSTPLDHTSILATLERRWGIAPLTARDKAAPDVGAVLTRTTPRTDDPLAGVVVPHSGVLPPSHNQPSHLQKIHADLVSQLTVPDPEDGTHNLPQLRTSADYDHYINQRTDAWKRSGRAAPPRSQ